MKRLFTAMLMMGLFCTLGCSKSGPAGLDGKSGINGVDGKDGINGINGKDGTAILSGTDKPSSTLGNIGDFYLDLKLSVLYGPKTPAGWGSGYEMKGKDGTNGQNGSDGVNGKDGLNGVDGKDGTKILSGYGFPLPDLGAEGDFYLDLGDFTLYGPKDVYNGWGMTGVMLKGTNGTDGRDGVDGKDADVRTYIISDPWNYYYTDVPSMGLFRFFNQGNFYISSYEADYGMVLVYIETNWADNSTSWFLAGTTLGSFTSNFISASEVVENSGVVSGVFLRTTNKVNGSSGWLDEADAMASTKISRVKVVVVSPVSISIMSRKGVNVGDVQAVSRYLGIK